MKERSGNARWLHLLHLEAEIERRLSEGSVTLNDLRVTLESVEEVFTDFGDPIKNFPSYALLRFSRKLREGLLACAPENLESRSRDSTLKT